MKSASPICQPAYELRLARDESPTKNVAQDGAFVSGTRRPTGLLETGVRPEGRICSWREKD